MMPVHAKLRDGVAAVEAAPAWRALAARPSAARPSGQPGTL